MRTREPKLNIKYRVASFLFFSHGEHSEASTCCSLQLPFNTICYVRSVTMLDATMSPTPIQQRRELVVLEGLLTHLSITYRDLQLAIFLTTKSKKHFNASSDKLTGIAESGHFFTEVRCFCKFRELTLMTNRRNDGFLRIAALHCS